MLAKINGVFRLTRDAELKYTQGGTAVLKLGLACSEKFKDKENALFIDGTIFGKPAEIINQYAGMKGTQISLSGKLQTEQWVDLQQAKRSKISMMIESFEFLPNNSNARSTQTSGYDANGGGNNNNGYNTPQQQQPYNPANDSHQQAPQQQNQQQPNSQPHPEYQQANQQAYQTQANQQASHMPKQGVIPEIDIDSEEIPFNGGQQSH